MKKIYFVFKEFPCFDKTTDTGVGKYIDLVSRGLAQRKWDVTIITRAKIPKKIILLKKNIRIIVLPQCLLYGFAHRKTIDFIFYNFQVAVCLLKEYLKFKKIVIEFANWEFEGFIFYILKSIFKLQAKIVVRLHSGTLDVAKGNLPVPTSVNIIHFIESQIIRRKDIALITSTKLHAEHSKEVYRLKNKDIHIIPLGIPVKNVQKTRKSDKYIDILFLGRLEKRKGIKEFIESIPKVLKGEKFVRYHIVGKYDELLFKTFNKFLTLIDRQKVFYYGYLKDIDISILFRQIDICIFPSYYESFGFSILEAMAYGKIVIATKVGGIPEIIQSEKNGILVPAKNTSSLVEKTLLLINNRKLLHKLSLEARQTVTKKFSLKEMILKSDLYYSLYLNRA